MKKVLGAVCALILVVVCGLLVTGIIDFPGQEKRLEAFAAELEQKLEERTPAITITMLGHADMEDLHEIFMEILDLHPEIFWLSGAANWTSQGSLFFTTYTLVPEYIVARSEIGFMKLDMESRISRILEETEECETEYEKAKVVHDALIKECSYDMNVYYQNGNASDLSYTSYGCLTGEKAVCAGYAKAFQLIMQRLGIECGYITGTAANELESGPHAWNWVKLDGVYTLVDVTWDDPVTYNGHGRIIHDYFGLGTEDMGYTHYPDEGQEIPECQSIH